ncbi:pterocarpan synthase 1-like [Benincasa hispida]|uniref:pterocarpan synthase 1-like n=1 Tax=Benincasa hispida TaxID=102211 RepID=UPI0019018660|nr:pterocarpan synthase 1-like [Benincasa hispida]
MATHFTTKLSLALILTTAAISATAVAGNRKLKQTNMILYLQDFANGPNPTFIPVAGVAGKPWNFTQFGTIFVTDNPITAGPEPNSTALGRAQGIYMVAAADGRNLAVVLTLALVDGSSIEIQGTSRQFEGVRELGVVSGTGKLRFARGFAVGKNVVTDIPNGYTVVQFNVTLKHY